MGGKAGFLGCCVEGWCAEPAFFEDGCTSADAWRQQPGSPAYCTSLSAEELKRALAQAESQFLAQRRELILEIIADRAAQNPEAITVEYVTAVNRLVTAGTF